MNKDEIILYIWNNKNVLAYCKVVGGNNWDELRSELIGQIYLMDINKLLQAYYTNFLEYLCFTICSRIKKGKIADTGIFYNYSSVNMETDAVGVDVIDDNVNVAELYDKVLSLIDEQHWYNKTLFKHYYIDGMKLREISEMYGINIKSIHYAIGKIKNEIKKQIEDDNNDFIWS